MKAIFTVLAALSFTVPAHAARQMHDMTMAVQKRHQVNAAANSKRVEIQARKIESKKTIVLK